MDLDLTEPQNLDHEGIMIAQVHIRTPITHSFSDVGYLKKNINGIKATTSGTN